MKLNIGINDNVSCCIQIMNIFREKLSFFWNNLDYDHRDSCPTSIKEDISEYTVTTIQSIVNNVNGLSMVLCGKKEFLIKNEIFRKSGIFVAEIMPILLQECRFGTIFIHSHKNIKQNHVTCSRPL